MKELNWKKKKPFQHTVHMRLRRSARQSREKWVTFTLWLKPSGSLHLIVIWLRNIDNRRLRFSGERRRILPVTLRRQRDPLSLVSCNPINFINAAHGARERTNTHAHTHTQAWKSATFRGSETWICHIKKREEWGATLMCRLVLVRVIFFTWKLAASNKILIQLLQGRRRLEWPPSPEATAGLW